MPERTCVFRKLKSVENKVAYSFKRFMLDASPKDPGSTVCFDHLQATRVSQWMTTARQRLNPRIGSRCHTQPLSGLLCAALVSGGIRLIMIPHSSPLIRLFCWQFPPGKSLPLCLNCTPSFLCPTTTERDNTPPFLS